MGTVRRIWLNIATGPVGWDALFKAFNDSPNVGLQFDPSHLVWQFMDPVQAARDFASKIYDVHLKDTEILWHVLRRSGIQPVDNVRWWRFRIPGYGSVDWKGFFTVLEEVGYTGAMNIENEDAFYYPAYDKENFTETVQERLPYGARIPEDASAAGQRLEKSCPHAHALRFHASADPPCVTSYGKSNNHRFLRSRLASGATCYQNLPSRDHRERWRTEPFSAAWRT